LRKKTVFYSNLLLRYSDNSVHCNSLELLPSLTKNLALFCQLSIISIHWGL
jgi:hypothetical protein